MTNHDRKTPPSEWDALQHAAPELVQFTAVMQGIQEATKGLALGLQGALAALPPLPAIDLSAIIEPIRDISAALQALPERTRIAATKAASCGWFIGPLLSLSAMRDLEGLEGRAAIDAFFEKHYREGWSEVEAFVLERLPIRRRLLREAFAAHREGRYALSIPVFLAQADGICEDALKGKGHLFTSNDGKVQERAQRLEVLIAQRDSRFMAAIIEPLKAALSSSAPLHLWEDSRDSFNRHAVLHGRDTDYATELNSLRCVSLIDSLTWTLHDRRTDP